MKTRGLCGVLDNHWLSVWLVKIRLSSMRCWLDWVQRFGINPSPPMLSPQRFTTASIGGMLLSWSHQLPMVSPDQVSHSVLGVGGRLLIFWSRVRMIKWSFGRCWVRSCPKNPLPPASKILMVVSRFCVL